MALESIWVKDVWLLEVEAWLEVLKTLDSWCKILKVETLWDEGDGDSFKGGELGLAQLEDSFEEMTYVYDGWKVTFEELTSRIEVETWEKLDLNYTRGKDKIIRIVRHHRWGRLKKIAIRKP